MYSNGTDKPCTPLSFLPAHLEIAYSLIWGTRRIWTQDLNDIMLHSNEPACEEPSESNF